MAPAQANRWLLLLGSEPFVHRLTAAPAEGNGVIEREPSLERPGWLIGEFDHDRVASDFLLEHHSLRFDADATNLIRPHRLAGRQQSQSHSFTKPCRTSRASTASTIRRSALTNPRIEACRAGSARTPRQRTWPFPGAAWSVHSQTIRRPAVSSGMVFQLEEETPRYRRAADRAARGMLHAGEGCSTPASLAHHTFLHHGGCKPKRLLPPTRVRPEVDL